MITWFYLGSQKNKCISATFDSRTNILEFQKAVLLVLLAQKV